MKPMGVVRIIRISVNTIGFQADAHLKMKIVSVEALQKRGKNSIINLRVYNMTTNMHCRRTSTILPKYISS